MIYLCLASICSRCFVIVLDTQGLVFCSSRRDNIDSVHPVKYARKIYIEYGLKSARCCQSICLHSCHSIGRLFVIFMNARVLF